MKYAIVEISGRQFWIEAGKPSFTNNPQTQSNFVFEFGCISFMIFIDKKLDEHINIIDTKLKRIFNHASTSEQITTSYSCSNFQKQHQIYSRFKPKVLLSEKER
jgi:hypothetical protein